MSNIPLLPEQMPPAYQVILSGQDESGVPIGYNHSGTIIAALPEQFDLSVTSNWAPIFPSPGLGGVLGALSGHGQVGQVAGLGGSLVTALASGTTGYTDQYPLFSSLYWVHTSPIEFTLNLQFNAIYDAKAEVMGNIRSLVMLMLPSYSNNGNGNFLTAPGPKLIGTSKYKINLAVGTAWTFSNVLIQDVHAQIDTMPTAQGDYISANVSVHISTDRIYTKQDLAKAFGGQAQSDPVSSVGTFLGNIGTSISNKFSGANPTASTTDDGAATSDDNVTV